MKNKHVLLFSGGLDSYIAYWWIKSMFKEEPLLLYVALGHKYQAREIMAIRALEDKYVIPSVTIDYSLNLEKWEEANANIPMRNSLLAHVAARYGQNIWMIVQKGETNIPDRTNNFFFDLTNMLTHLNDKIIKVDSPFWHMTKVDMVRWYKENKFSIPHLLKTSSCYSPAKVGDEEIGCGNCSACFRRWVAFELNDIEEKYQIPPWVSDMAIEYRKRGQVGFYGEGRDEEILQALARKGYHNDNK